MHGSYSRHKLISHVKQKIYDNRQLFTNVELLEHARIPIIKLKFETYGIDFDISFNEINGVLNIEEIEKANRVHPELKFIFFVLKIFLQ